MQNFSKLFSLEKDLLKKQLRIYGHLIKLNNLSHIHDSEYRNIYYFLKGLCITNYDFIEILLRNLDDKELLIVKTIYIDLNNKNQIECILNVNKRKAYYEAEKILERLTYSSLESMVSKYEFF